ncbi:MAG: PstS family phosphate ABC transporter substrate-binding protein [Cytophagales bacterium]|nr:MAG: PstS family phosphate ABC transporter substrate-binding protein [Cytophagales bacterium]
MKNKFLIPVILAGLFTACNQKSGSESSSATDENILDSTANVGTIEIDGSSTVYPITEAVVEEFRVESPTVKVTIGVSGTGGGFKKFGRGEIAIANASRPIKPVEDSTCTAAGIEYIELPVAYDGLAIVVHKDNSWLNDITVKELKMIWEPSAQGKITKWNQVRKTWPNEEIHLLGAGTQSGTFDYFTEAIVGKAKACRGDYTASEDDNVLVQGVSTDKNAMAFFGIDYYEVNKDKLKLVPVNDENDSNGKGAIAPSQESVKNGTYQPLSRPLFIYINKKFLAQSEMKSFAKFYIDNAQKLVGEAGYIPFSSEAYTLIGQRLEKQTTGSVFLKLKTTVGVKMEDVVKME